jgi:hypothetical protein
MTAQAAIKPQLPPSPIFPFLHAAVLALGVFCGAVFSSVFPSSVFAQSSFSSSLVLPFVDDFSAYTPGVLPTDFPVASAPEGRVFIHEDESGDRSLKITSGDPMAGVTYSLSAPTDFGSIAWIDAKVKTSATVNKARLLDVDGVFIAFVKEGTNAARFYAYDGKLGLANGGGAWKALGETIAVDASTLQPAAFAHVTVRADYIRHKYDVWINGTLVAVNLGFDDSTVSSPTSLSFYGQLTGESFFGDVSIGNTTPASLPASTANDGIPDTWKTTYGIALTNATLRDQIDSATNLSLIEKYFYGVTPVGANAGAELLSLIGHAEFSGGFFCEVWHNIDGGHVSQLRAVTEDFRKLPNLVSLTAGAQPAQNTGDKYGRRLRGYITIPESGEYRFYVTGDDGVELYIGEDEAKWNKAKAAQVLYGWVALNNWSARAEQKSRVYSFTAGQKVYVEILHKEGGGNDHVELGWTTPVSSTISVVPSNLVSSYVRESNDLDDDDLPDAWETANNISVTDNGATNPLNGKHGIRNSVGLTNYQCYKLNLDPDNPDISAVWGAAEVPGALTREVWTNITENEITNLTSSVNFAAVANQKTFVQPANSENSADNYGERWRGWLTAPETGFYKLGIHADDRAELWVSSNADLRDKKRVATVKNVVGGYQFKYAEQKSVPLWLEAGEKYYIEVLYKENTLSAFCQISWQTPWDTNFVPLPAEHVSSWVQDASLDRLGYSLEWLSQNALSENTLLPDAKFQADSYLTNWQASRLNTDPRLTAAQLATLSANNGAQGWIREFWYNAAGGTIDANKNKFLTTPDRREVVLGGDDFTAQITDAYISRARGYIVAPANGLYRIAVNGDDDVELHLSTDAQPVNARRLINATDSTAWDTWTNAFQQSNSVYLQAGKRYYIEILHHEIGGDDFLRVAWQTPGNDVLEFIPASAMRPYVPEADDPLGFGYPQSWIESTGLSALSLDKQAPWADANNDGLTNLEKFYYGLNPLSADTDGDGISDYEEIKLAGTNATTADFDGTSETIVSINGANFAAAASTGNWQITGTSAYAADIRGALVYNFTLEIAGIFRLLATGGQYLSASTEKILSADIYIDGIYAGRVMLDLLKSGGDSATAALWLPRLAAGTHTLRLVWLNGVVGSALRIDTLALESRGGSWLAARQNSLSSVDATAALSYTSPYCLEGRAPEASLLQIATDYTPAFTATDAYSLFNRNKFYTENVGGTLSPALFAQPALRGQFYSDLPLSPTTATALTINDIATGAQHAKTITWQPYNISEHNGESFYLRTGDALLLQATTDILITAPDGTQTTLAAADFQNTENTTIGNSGTGEGATAPTAPFVFTQDGTYTIATNTSVGGVTTTHSNTVHAVRATLAPAPTAILGQTRDWTPSLLPDTAVLYNDDGLTLHEAPLKNNKRTLFLNALVTHPQIVLARLGETGAILAVSPVNILQNASRAATTFDIIQVFDDGTVMLKAMLSFGGNIPEDFKVKLTMYKAGSVFDDGTTVRWIMAADFDANGTYTYYMLLPKNVTGSACHSALYYDGDELISTNL